MRDVVLTLVILGLLVGAIRTPVVAAYLWAWLSLMNPHKLTYGFAFSFPFAYMAALVMLAMLLVTKEKRPLPKHPVIYWQMALLFWMTVTSFFAIAPRDEVLERWILVAKIQFMCFASWMLVRDAKQIRTMAWVVALSVGFFGIKGGIWTVIQGGGGRVWGPPGGLLQGNNELAVGLVMLMPIFFFLWQTEKRMWVRRFLMFSMISCAFSVLGSQSRGALVGLLAMAFFLGLKGRYPIRTSLGLGVLLVLVISFMPDTWTARMETMGTYQQDTSAMSRVWTWKTLWNAAVDRPLVGAGLRADNPLVFERYSPKEPPFDIFAGQVFVAHSIYLQMLGEHGFVGLFLFLGLGVTTWITAGRLARRCKADAELNVWVPVLMRMVQVSLIGFGTGGAFLSLAYLDLLYYIIGFVPLCDALLQECLKRPAPQAAEPVGAVARRVNQVQSRG